MTIETPKKNQSSILIVEDNKDIQESLKLALEQEGFEVYTADNGFLGLELLKKIPSPCLILLDLMMPVMNGWEFVENISKDILLSNIPVIVVSAFADQKDSVKSNGFIQKPIDLDSLLTSVNKHCN